MSTHPSGYDAWVSTGDVAAALSMHIETVRRALVEHVDYARLSKKERRGKVPCLWVGKNARIPRYWLLRAVAATKPPPE